MSPAAWGPSPKHSRLLRRKYDGAEPVNVGSGQEISIRALAGLIAKEVGYTGKLAWDTSRPDGQPRRLFDSSRARKWFGFKAQMQFEKGLRLTIQDYMKKRGR